MGKLPFDVFQDGLVRGEEKMPYDPEKAYFYVEHPEQGWRVYLRSCVFIHVVGSNDPSKFVVVKKTGTKTYAPTWEPPKGQMEGKDALKHTRTPIWKILEENARREVEEEAGMDKLRDLKLTGLVFQASERDYKPNTYFQYHIFRAFVTQAQYDKAVEYFAWRKEHPAAVARMKRDRREKDAVAWFDPRKTKMMGRWSPAIVAMYLDAFQASR